jgi:hypothetical protein
MVDVIGFANIAVCNLLLDFLAVVRVHAREQQRERCRLGWSDPDQPAGLLRPDQGATNEVEVPVAQTGSVLREA